MESNISVLLPLLIILLTGLLVSEFFTHMKLPFATAIIFMGAILGPHGLEYVALNEVILFFGFLGSAFLMFMAGLDTDLPVLKKMRSRILFLVLLNGGIPMITGVAVARLFGYSWLIAFLLGTIFLSSSVAIVFSVMKTLNIRKETSQIILATAIFEDILSLLLFAVVLQSKAPLTAFPLPVYFTILVGSLVLLALALPRLATMFIQKKSIFSLFSKNVEEDRLRFTIIVLIAVLLYFSFLGVHPILAAFFVGLLLSQDAMGENIYEKFHTLSYGLFVPVFFFIIGMELDLGVFLEAGPRHYMTLAVVGGLLLSKFGSGYLAGILTHMQKKEALSFGVVTTTQLTTTLAVAYAAFSAEIIDQRLMTACIVLAIITNIFVPLCIKLIESRA